MTDEIRIRPATPEDAPVVHRFIAELAEFEREPEAVETTPEGIREQLAAQSPPFECLLAEVAGEAAGFALFFPNYSTWLGRQGIYLEDLYVSPAFRRRGIARALLKRVAEIALERGAGRLELSVLDWNEGAMGFYRALGACPLDSWTTWRLTDRELGAIANGAGGQ